jgi:adenylate cyclase
MISIVNYYTASETFSFDLSFLRKRLANVSWFSNLSMPSEENRIFLFLDLNNSTAIAENMGHLKYSMFLSRFFKDFQASLKATKGQIYQYVGDEVVVSWPYSEQNIQESVRLINHFQHALRTHSQVYHKKFSCIPDFKAALHHGKVAVSRIGIRKVYRGDILNTCARMLELASKFKIGLVASTAFAEGMKQKQDYDVKEMEDVVIRGKAQSMKIYSIS